MKSATNDILLELLTKYPQLDLQAYNIKNAVEILQNSYDTGGMLLVCGNGGSAADSDHIAGELMKGFHLKRPLSIETKYKIIKAGGDAVWVDSMQCALPVINLSAQTALGTAISNDIGYEVVFAQQVLGYSNSNNCLLGISTSGNSNNVIKAGIVAKAFGMKTIALVGGDGGKMKQVFDLIICAPGRDTAEVQELHLPIYHAICSMLEIEYFEA